MTLKQIFTAWSMMPENIVLSARYRDAVNKVLMKKYADTDIKTITQQIAQEILSQSSERQELKSKAASVIISLLEYGGEKGYCDKPRFGFEALSAIKKNTKIPADIADADIENSPSESVIATEIVSLEEKENTQPQQKEKIMEKKRTSGRPPHKVCQLDPKTLKVVNTYESVSAGGRAVGVKNLDRAIKKHQRAGGFYWASPEDVENFKPAEKHPSGNTTSKILQIQNAQQKEKSFRLSSVSNEELIEEIRRRGWKGNVEMTVKVEL